MHAQCWALLHLTSTYGMRAGTTASAPGTPNSHTLSHSVTMSVCVAMPSEPAKKYIASCSIAAVPTNAGKEGNDDANDPAVGTAGEGNVNGWSFLGFLLTKQAHILVGTLTNTCTRTHKR